jgi:RNase P protein component
LAQLRTSVLFTLLILGSVLGGVGLIYGLFHDSEKLEGNRYENSYAGLESKTLTAKQLEAITLLKAKGIEWAHFRFIEALKNGDAIVAQAFAHAGMPLNSDTILLEIALSKVTDKKDMLALLREAYQVDFNALYKLPNYVSDFDDELASIAAPYIQQKEKAYRLAMAEYKKSFFRWEQELEAKKLQMLAVCTNDVCRNGQKKDVRHLFAESEPKEPTMDYIVKERVNVSLLTLFAWQKDHDLQHYISEKGAELIVNKLFLTDGKLLYFTVDKMGFNTLVGRDKK